MYDIEGCPKYRLYRPYRPEPFNSVVAPRVPLCRLFNVKLVMYPNPKIARIWAIVRVFVRRKNPDKNTQL